MFIQQISELSARMTVFFKNIVMLRSSLYSSVFYSTQMIELARTQISDAVSAPAAPVTTLFDHQRQHHSEFVKQLRARTDTNRFYQMFHILGMGK